MNNFLPHNYEAPRAISGYTKLEDGENRLRILTSAIVGWEDWTRERKPVRFRFDEKPAASIDPTRPVRHFWAMVVWNYKDQLIQVWEVTQSSIRKRLQELAKDDEWGAPYEYDIKIVKSGEKVDTEYSVNPVPHKAIDPSIIEAFRSKPIWLDALFTNEDPFAPGGRRTSGFWEGAPSGSQRPLAVSVKPKSDLRPPEDAIDIECFMDFLPMDFERERVEQFAVACAKASKVPLEVYLAKTIDNIDHFVDCYGRWLEKLPPTKKAATA